MSFVEFYRNQHLTLPVACTETNCAGKTFIVTGANTGLGLEAAKHLVRCKSKLVILAVRSLSKGKEALKKIEEETGVTNVGDVWQLDLGSHKSVKEFAKRMQELDRVDALIENASVAMMELKMVEGLETTLTVNVVSTFLLAALALPKLQETARKVGEKTHLTIIGSGTAYEFVPKGYLEKIPGDILDHLSAANADGKTRYPVSKLLQLYALRQFAALHPSSEGVIMDYVNPGLCITELDRNATWLNLFKTQIWVMRKILGRSAEEGSRTLLHGAFADEECHGKYLSECVNKENVLPEWLYGPSGQKMQQRVWESLVKKINKIEPGCI